MLLLVPTSCETTAPDTGTVTNNCQQVYLTSDQMQEISAMASQGAHDQLLMLGFCVMLLAAIALMQAITS